MKKIIPVLLINLIFLNTFGFNLLLDYLIFKCRKDFSAERIYNSDEIVILKITPNERKNLQVLEDDEVRFKGEMYDVVKKIIKNNVLYIHAINDKKENRLFEILFKIDKNNDPNDHSAPVYAKNILIKNYILKETELFYFQFNKERFFTNTLLTYKSPAKDIILPPPELIS
jgi:hypothetical protein